MSNILLVEPEYRSKFPPLGLLRISTYHKRRGDAVTFVRGRNEDLRDLPWHRVYVSSLFTWELPRTVKTIRHYLKSVSHPSDIVVGGIGATLFPEYIRNRIPCTVITGPLDKRGKLGKGIPALEKYIPDYDLLDSVDWDYQPKDAFFCRATKGCIRKCKFCAVPRLEPEYGLIGNWRKQLRDARKLFGERRNILFLDNNILAGGCFEDIVAQIKGEGFERGATLDGRRREVDFNQGIDARLVTREKARALGRICLRPIRLAFDYDAVETRYRRAVRYLADEGFTQFTTYVMFNFTDTPESLYRRMRVNLELSEELDIQITAFPMRYIPITDIHRRHVGARWRWRYLRGIQCVLLATHGMVSPNTTFFEAAFGSSFDEFLEILSMPDRYIIHREKHKNQGAAQCRKLFRKLPTSGRTELLGVLALLNRSRDKKAIMKDNKKFRSILEHYYPDGEVVRG